MNYSLRDEKGVQYKKMQVMQFINELLPVRILIYKIIKCINF